MTDTSLVFAGKVDTVSQWTDVSGYGNHAIQPTAANQPSIVSGSTSIVMNATSGGSAYYFDGTPQPNQKHFYIEYNSSLRFDNNWTISYWVNSRATLDGGRIFFNHDGSVGMYIYISDATNPNKLKIYVVDTIGAAKIIASNTDVKDGLWHNTVVQRGGGYFWIYIDGKYDNKVADTLGDIGTSAPIYIGANANGYAQLDAYLVAPRFWQRLLTPSEIEKNYELGLIGIRG